MLHSTSSHCSVRLRQNSSMVVARIKTALMERVAPTQTPRGQHNAAHYAMDLDSFNRISGTGWMESTMLAEIRAQKIPITLDDGYGDPFR